MKKAFILMVASGILVFLQPLSAQTWETTKRLTWNPGTSASPEIAIDSSDNIHLVWADETPGNLEIYYKKSADGGTTWTTKRLTWISGWSERPVIATDSSDNIHVTWYDYNPGNPEIFYKKSTDGGITWTTKRLTTNSTQSVAPDITIDSNDNIHLVWYNEETTGDYEIFYKKSTDGGTTWTTKRLTWNTEWSERPYIATDSNDNIYVVWYDFSPGNPEIFYKKSTDGGITWTTKRLTSSSSNSIFPEIAIDSKDNINVIYRNDMPGNAEIYFKRSTNGGSLWTTTRLTWNSGASHGPTITTDSINNIHVAWFDWTPGNFEIFYKRSTNGGVTWEDPHKLTWNSGSSNFPRLGTDSSNNIHLVWHDESSGNFEIYYRKGIQ